VAGPILAAALLLAPRPVAAQFAVSDLQLRPFVVGITPVVGRGGAVGGVSIDARGVVARSDVDSPARLAGVRAAALAAADGDLAAASPLRKVSLRGLAAELDRLRREGAPLSAELQNLAGLTRIEYVLVYPERKDIVLAGPAEGWHLDDQLTAIGRTSGRPILQLDDLVVALRAAKAQPATGELITCSIDPTEEGSRRFSRMMATLDPPLSKAETSRLEKAVGPQQVTITGIPPGSHFAHVLVAADFRMKLLGMNLEAAPIDGLPSYLELLRSGSAGPRAAAPRWWLAPHYEPLGRDADSLAWQIRGAGVMALSEDGYFSRRGRVASTEPSEDSLAKKWADALTARYEALSAKVPVFGQLRSCMDLAVVGALLIHHDLPGRAGCDLGLLLDDKRLAVAEHHVPKTLASRASLLKKDREWIISVSGGVEIDSWSVLKQVEVQPELSDVRTTAGPTKPERWWWD
jgi:hypothetical protein